MGTGASMSATSPQGEKWMDEATAQEMSGDRWSKALFDEHAVDGKLSMSKWEELRQANESDPSATEGAERTGQPVKRQRRQRKKNLGLPISQCTDSFSPNVSTYLLRL